MDKLYTVDDVAMMTELTSRTIRNYLKDGILKGKKVGVQWRFTEEDIKALFKDKGVEREISDNKNKLVLEFLDEKDKGAKSICSVIDYPGQDQNQIEQICEKIICTINNYSESDRIEFSYQYFQDEKLARFIIIGSPNLVLELITIIK